MEIGPLILLGVALVLIVIYVFGVLINETNKAKEKHLKFEELKAKLKKEKAFEHDGSEFTALKFNKEVEKRSNLTLGDGAEDFFKELYSSFNAHAEKQALISNSQFDFDLTKPVMNFIRKHNYNHDIDEVERQAELMIESIGVDYVMAQMMVYIEGLGYKTNQYVNVDYTLLVNPVSK